MALIGYARVFPLEQDPSLQHDAVAAAGCQRIFSDHASGALDERVELARTLDHLRVGDTLAECPWCWAYVAGERIFAPHLGFLVARRIALAGELAHPVAREQGVRREFRNTRKQARKITAGLPFQLWPTVRRQTRARFLEADGGAFRKTGGMTTEQLLEAITSHYLESGDFNGYPLCGIALAREELEPLMSELVEAELISLHIGIPHPNPYIKAFRARPVQVQLDGLAKLSDLTHLTAYPETRHLETVVARDDYQGRPFTLRMALGEGQLEPTFFDLSVLEAYRNDPRYYYRTNDTSGRISVSDAYYESEHMREADQVLLETFGYGFAPDMRRVVCAFHIYLSRLSPEHQQIWSARELRGEYKLHPAYFTSAILGDFPDKVMIFDAFLEELAQLRAMCQGAGLPLLMRSDFRDSRPANFTFLIRPTLKELQDFHGTLDKLMSDNLNKEFFTRFDIELEHETERADGKIEVRQKGTIQLLKDWMDRFQTQDRADLDEAVKTFREVRELRQRPAHAVDDNRFDLDYYDQQRQLMMRAYKAVRLLRLVMATHPALADYNGVPDWLCQGQIYDY